MREIKFRALKDDISDCRFVYGNLIYSENNEPRIQAGNTFLFTTCIKGTEGQYIGFKDTYGKEIYEGDIVQLIHGYKGRFYKGEIKCEDYYFFAEEFYFPHYDTPHDIFSEGTEYLEVIGNIHENPELL